MPALLDGTADGEDAAQNGGNDVDVRSQQY